MKLYVAIANYGEWEDHTSDNIYVGDNYDAAVAACENFLLPHSYYESYSAYIQIWEDGKFVEAKCIVEYKTTGYIDYYDEDKIFKFDIPVGKEYFPYTVRHRNRIGKNFLLLS